MKKNNVNNFLFFFLFFCFISGTFVGVLDSVLASDLPADSWSPKASLQQARGGLGVVAMDSKVYAIGGKTSGGVFVGTNECYSPASDSWVVLEPMPTYRAYFATAVLEGKIYCMGGVGKGGACSITEVYDAALDSWSAVASLPISGGNLQAGVVDGKIFVLHGCDLFVYDPVADVWVQKTGISVSGLVGSNFITSAVVDNTIVVVGDFIFSSSRSETRVFIYDVKSDVWREGAKPSFEAFTGVVGATSGSFAPKRIYFIGTITTCAQYVSISGIVDTDYSVMKPFIWAFDPVKNVWASVQASANRVDFGVAVVDDVLYVVGGYDIAVEEASIAVGREEFVGDNTWNTRVVYDHFVVQYSVVGEATSLNLQYVPAGYSSDAASVPSMGPSDSPILSEYSLNGLVGVLVLIIVIVAVVGLFLYFKKGAATKEK